MADPVELVASRRHMALITVRSIAAAMVVGGAVILITAMVRAILWSGPGGIRDLLSRYESVAQLSLGVTCMAAGTALAAAAGRLARWLVPPLRPTCPNCGYSLRSPRPHTCPECGFELAHPPT